MKGLRKDGLVVKVQKRRVAYDGFAVGNKKDGVLSADECRNCDCRGGVLRGGVGLDTFVSDKGNEIKLAAALAQPKRFFKTAVQDNYGVWTGVIGYVTEENVVYVYDEGASAWEKQGAFSLPVFPVTAIDSDCVPQTLFVGENGVFLWRDGKGMLATEITEPVVAACFFRGRLFVAIAPFTVRYSAPYAPTDFADSLDDGGSIVFYSDKGNIVAFAPLKNALCIFYERGIAVIEYAASGSGFVRKDVAYGGGRIFGRSVGVCAVGGEKAVFLADDGLYVFDGNRVKRTCENIGIFPKRDTRVCDYAQIDGRYVLTYTDERDGLKTVVLDVESGEGCFAFVPTGLGGGDGVALCAYGNKVRRLCLGGDLPDGEERIFTAHGVEFGNVGVKTLKTLAFTGDGEFTMTVKNGKKEKNFAVVLKNGRACVRVDMRGRAFDLAFVLQKGAAVRSVAADVEILQSVGE